MTPMASVNASTASACMRRGTPMLAIASQKKPAPMPSTNRPPDRRSRLAADLAVMAGECRAMLSTLGPTRIRSVRAAIQVISAQLSR